MINSDETTSMRNLSTSIGASDSFIQKILTEKANPSLDKIDLISEYFDVESWEMLYNFRKDNDDMLHACFIEKIQQYIFSHSLGVNILAFPKGVQWFVEEKAVMHLSLEGSCNCELAAAE